MTQKPPKKSAPRRLISFTRFFILAGILAFGIGFAIFSYSVSQASPPESIGKVDGIVVLTGPGGGRLETGARLLSEGKGERLLVSGVDRSVSNDALKNLLGLDNSRFDCCVDIDRRADNTVGNATETASWARALGFEHLIIVTSDYHIPRTLLEMSQVTGDMRLTPYPVPVKDAAQEAMGESRFVSLLREYAKLVVIYIRHMGQRSEAPPMPVPAPERIMEETHQSGHDTD